MTKLPLRALLAAVSLALVALLAVACSGSDDDSASDTDVAESVIDGDAAATDGSDPDAGSGSGTGGAGAELPDPCTLLTADQVGAVLGAPAETNGPEELLGAAGATCTYSAAGAATLELRVHAGREAYDCGQDACASGGFATEGQIEPVSGLGEEAYVDNGSFGVARIAWYRDDRTVEVLINDGVEHTAADYEAVAQQADAALG